MVHLTKEAIENLEKYKYNSGGYSWLDNKFDYFWKWFVEFMPKTLSANALTLIGFSSCVLSYLTMLIYDSTLTKNIPSWTFYFSALCIFSWQTFDAIDGKQARRTNSSSPLGQLFDHGTDSLCIVFLVLGYAQSIKLDSTTTLYFLIVYQAAWWFGEWSEHCVVVRRTHIGNVGITEGQLLLIVNHIVTGIYGQDLWAKTLKELLPSATTDLLSGNPYLNFIPGVSLTSISIVVMLSTPLFTILAFTFLTLTNCKSVVRALVLFVPITTMLSLECLWKDFAIFKTYTGFGLISFGLMSSMINCKLIICSMTKLTFPLLHWELLIPLISTLVFKFYSHKMNSVQQMYLFAAHFFFTLVSVILFVGGIYRALRKHLGISFFSIQKAKKN